MQILLTGATGFVGDFFLEKCVQHIVVLGRSKPNTAKLFDFFKDELSGDASYSSALQNISVVIHCAARAHIMQDSAEDPLEQYMAVNYHGTLNLARQAAAAGVKRFIFLSSIKVNGE
ncbi:MAG: NAD-dependent epimerase/dehydratase family protein, partial [Aeromonas sp.]